MKRIKILFFINFLVLIVGFLPTSMNVNSTSDSIGLNDDLSLADLSSWWWEPLELLSAESDSNNFVPKIAIDNQNNIHIITYSVDAILGSGTDRDVFYKKFIYETKSWSELELVSTDSSGASEVSEIAVDPAGTVHIAWLESDAILGSGVDRDICYRQKTSSGWGSTELVSTESDSTSTYLAIIADSNGVAHVVWEDFVDYLIVDGDQDIYYKHRSTAGIWSAAEIVTDMSTSSTYSPDIQLDSQENIFIAWYDLTNILGSGNDGDVFYRKLNKELISWSPIKLISSGSDESSSGLKISKGVEGQLHIVWQDDSDILGSGTDTDILYRYYDSNLDSLSVTEVVSTASTGSSFNAEIDVYGTDYVYVIWQDASAVGGVGIGNNIFFKYLDLNTHTWSSRAILTYDHTSASTYPDLAVDSLGHVHAIFLDADGSLLGSGSDTDLFYKKFVGTPMQPILAEINPNPISTGNISLSWSSAKDVINYEIYRETSQFSSVSGLTAIDTSTLTSYTDTVNATGYYYYAIVATNEYGDSFVSNVEFIEVIEETSTGIFASLGISELLILAGIVLGLQLIFFLLTITIITGKYQSTAKPKTRKKK